MCRWFRLGRQGHCPPSPQRQALTWKSRSRSCRANRRRLQACPSRSTSASSTPAQTPRARRGSSRKLPDCRTDDRAHGAGFQPRDQHGPAHRHGRRDDEAHHSELCTETGKAGAGLKASFAVANAVTGAALVPSAVRCAALAARANIPGRGSVAAGRAVCTFHPPRTATGKTLRGAISAMVAGKRLRKSFAVRLR